MSVYDHLDYKKWVNDHVLSMRNRGRGQYRRIAENLNTTPTIVTQVFKGDRDLTPEQAVLLAKYFGLTKPEAHYLLLLVQYARAGTHLYKEVLAEQIREAKKLGQEIQSHVHQDHKLTAEAKAVLYSNWYYLAIWSLTAVPGFNSVEIIAERLNLQLSKVREATEFLLQYGLIKEISGRLEVGPTLIHLESTSPQIPRHHQNWRLQAFKNYENPKASDVSYTAPITLSEKDAIVIKNNILEWIAKTVDHVKDSPSEKLHCLCIDWFEV